MYLPQRASGVGCFLEARKAASIKYCWQGEDNGLLAGAGFFLLKETSGERQTWVLRW